MQVAGSEFDAAQVPDNTDELTIHQIRKSDLVRLKGLERLGIRSLNLRWVSAPDFRAIPLPEKLECLQIMQSSKLRSCDGIEQARHLRAFTWSDSGVFDDGQALARLSGLTSLKIENGMTGKQKVGGFDFLRATRIEELILQGIAPHDLDVAPILEMTSLKRIWVQGSDWDIESLAALAARFPAIHDTLHDLEDYPADLGMKCKTCGGTRKMMNLRRRKFLWCPICEASSLENALAGFDAMVEAARQAGVQSVSGVKLVRE